MRILGRPSRSGLVALAVMAALVAASLGTLGSLAKSSGGGTVTWAEPPGTTPNYIFPLLPGAYFSNANYLDLVEPMYLPLYWFGQNGQPKFDESLSIAQPPVFSDNNSVVSVTLKHWRWSDGAPITARDVMFWMNMVSAVTDPNAPLVGTSQSPGPGWGGSVPGGFPENIVSYTQTGTYSLQFKLNTSYNPVWYLYNELSQIFPLPQAAWDRLSSSGPVGDFDASAEARTTLPGTTPAQYVPTQPGTASTGALGVAQLLNLQSGDLATYATNPLWQTVDGPFKLSQFTTSGFVKFTPNSVFSGSPKPAISAFEELPFTSDSAEFNALRSGSLTIGYLPFSDVAERSSLERSEGYKYNVWNQFAINYLRINFTNPTTGPMLKQLYFRQAFQSLVNQPEYIKDFQDGIGIAGNGPVPGYPPHNADLSPQLAKGLAFPYDPAKAVSLLKNNGWTVKAGGTSDCSHPGTAAGDCGAGVASGQAATVTLLYASGYPELTNEMEAMQSTMKKEAGIELVISEQPSTIIDSSSAGCTPTTPCSNWDLIEALFGLSWVYVPDYFPTGEEILFTGAVSNVGYYSNPTADADITATTTAPSKAAELAALYKYENYVTKQVPIIWMPLAPYQLTVYKSKLTGLLPQGIYDEIYPQDYRL